MAGIRPKEIVAAVPSAITIVLPDDWFDNLPDNVSVFESLYRWMVGVRGIDPQGLHNRTYAGAGVTRRLRASERRRIARRKGLRGADLERALNFSDMNAGPHSLFGELLVLGDALVVIPEEDDKRAQAAKSAMLKENSETKNRKIRDMASGSNFGQWLASNLGRDDPIGDLAGDVARDESFPRTGSHYQEILAYMSRQGACFGALDALAEAWMEYSLRYPGRVTMSAWCAACETRVADFDAGVVALTEDEALQVLHRQCLRGDELDLLDLVMLSEDASLDALTQFAERHDLSVELVAETERLLRLWGFAPSGGAQNTMVYFIQAGVSGPIKIGYSAGKVERRLAALQTAHPEPLRLLAQLEGTRETETELHRRFGAHRRSGEWFDPHPDLVAFIAVLQPRKPQ